MKNFIRDLVRKKYFHICIIIIIITVLLFILGIIVLRYSVEGETNMPFNLSKITVISTSEGTDKDAGENRWAFDINQNNDIYLYIEKNDKYKGTEAIKTININNIVIEKDSDKGENNIYKPDDTSENIFFSSKEENKVEEIEYIGSMQSNFGQMKISNQGGIVAFRYGNDKLAEYISNDEEINHSNLLKNSGTTNEELKVKMTFDLTIKIESGKEYMANVSLDLPVGDVIEEGTTSIEITDLSNIIFKRIKN